MRNWLVLVMLAWLAFPAYATDGDDKGYDVSIDAPKILLTNVPFEVSVAGAPANSVLYLNDNVVDDPANLKITETGTAVFELRQAGTVLAGTEIATIPGWTSILPPLVAIFLAFLARSVIPALFVGLFVGAWGVNGFTAVGAFKGFFETVTIYIVDTSTNYDHMTIMVFTFLIGGMIGIISKNGGMVGIVNRILPIAHTPKRGQGVVALLGLSIFFDDYANTMIVGNATRPMSDRLKISREKLAYLVDSTAAPVATVAVITTWIGFQVGLIDSAIENLDGITESPYLLFLNSIPYSFYPFLAIALVFLVVYSGKDFGPMHAAEMRARKEGKVVADGSQGGSDSLMEDLKVKKNADPKAMNAVLPILTMVLTVVFGLYISGEGETLTDIIGSANSYIVLMWASLLACAVAAILTMGQRILSLNELVDAWLAGARFMLTGLVLLVLAWAVADVAAVLQTAPYLVSILGDSLSPQMLPALVFLLAGATAFASGSSWGVMAILMPLVIPLTWAVLQAHDMASPEHMHILYSSIACVLTGAVWADHCSPISDTTVLSSLATGCDHMDHVRTQIPYALLGGGIALLIGVLPTAFGLPWFVMLASGLVVLMVIHRMLGKPTDAVL